jgi:membrane fusion protein, multidrug efflux system
MKCAPELHPFDRLALLPLAVTLMLLGGCQNRAANKRRRTPRLRASLLGSDHGRERADVYHAGCANAEAPGIHGRHAGLQRDARPGHVPAVVVPVQELATFRNTYVAAQAQLQKARIEAGVADKEYARLKALFGPEQNVSEKSLQAAEAALQSDDADVHAAEQQLNLQASALRQEWGGVVTEWATEGSRAAAAHLADRKSGRGQALVEMTMPAGTTFAPPKSISLELPGGKRTQATFVSTIPGSIRAFKAEAFCTLQPTAEIGGAGASSGIESGGASPGRKIAEGSCDSGLGRGVVGGQGLGLLRRSRRSASAAVPVPTDVPVEGGFFAAEGFSAGDKIVTVGAQALLSEEMLLHSQGGGDEN